MHYGQPRYVQIGSITSRDVETADRFNRIGDPFDTIEIERSDRVNPMALENLDAVQDCAVRIARRAGGVSGGVIRDLGGVCSHPRLGCRDTVA